MGIPVLLFLVGLVLLIKGGDWFVDGATGIAHRFRIPELLIGATVVSIGTTLPEVMVSAASALSGHGEIAYGNAVGSVICNTSLIAALTVAVRPGRVDPKALRTPVIFFFVTAVFYAGVAYLTGYFSRAVGVVLLAVFLIYMVINVVQVTRMPKAAGSAPGDASGNARESALEEAAASRAGGSSKGKAAGQPELRAAEYEAAAPGQDGPGGSGKEAAASTQDAPKEPGGLAVFLAKLVAGAALIAVGADLLVDNGTLIAQALGVPESVIALTFVALGTSLPELVTAITSLIKGHGALSLGNVIGANLFNLVLVSGLSVTLSPFQIPQSAVLLGHNASLVLDMPVMFSVMALLCVPALAKGRLYRSQGILLLIIYGAFCVIQFTM